MGLSASLVSSIVGYDLFVGNFNNVTRNLPHRIVIMAEANDANQATLNTTAKEVISAQQAGILYGYGSPIYHIMRILRPYSGGGVGSIPTIVMPQAKASGATAKKIEVTPTGVATGNGTHRLIIAGRAGLEAKFYNINIVTGDTTDDISDKIADAVNDVLGAPCTAAATDYEATLTTKWSGLTANEFNVSVDTGDDDLGITYAINVTQTGSGTPSIAGALSQFGNSWNTIVVNGYGTETTTMAALEAFNGKPATLTASATGRYDGKVWKPFIAITGSVSDDPSAITDARSTEVTIAIAPAPNSSGFSFEAAANAATLFAPQAQDEPELDVFARPYPDMPIPETGIGTMEDYDSRDAIVKKGCSTVENKAGQYVIVDFVTTYHPAGEDPPQYRYCRNLNIDWNMKFRHDILVQLNVIGHVIANDDDTLNVQKVVKPKQFRALLDAMADEMVGRGLIVDAPFMQESISVSISTTNPDRLEDQFKYKRSGFARIVDTEATAGFNFGTVN